MNKLLPAIQVGQLKKQKTQNVKNPLSLCVSDGAIRQKYKSQDKMLEPLTILSKSRHAESMDVDESRLTVFDRDQFAQMIDFDFGELSISDDLITDIAKMMDKLSD